MRMAIRRSFARLRFFSPILWRSARGAAHRIDHAFELDQRDIAGLLEDLSAVLDAQRRDDLGQNRPQLGEALDLVSGKQSAVAGDQDCRQTAPCS